MGNINCGMNDDDIIGYGQREPEKLKGAASCKVSVSVNASQGIIDIRGALMYAGFQIDFDAGSVRLSRVDFEDELAIYYERPDLNKDGDIHYMSGKAINLTKKLAFRKRVAINSEQYSHLLRFGGVTTKLEGSETMFQRLLHRPVSIPVGLYNDYEIRANPSRAYILGCAKLCQESHGWYGRGLNYFVDIYGDTEVVITIKFRRVDCLTYLWAAACAPRFLLSPVRTVLRDSVRRGVHNSSTEKSRALHKSDLPPLPQFNIFNTNNKTREPPYPSVRNNTNKNAKAAINNIRNVPINNIRNVPILNKRDAEEGDSSMSSMHTTNGKTVGTATALAGRQPLYKNPLMDV
eukprot:GHVO01010317.1.p1 GENE.GHVO01010317.1~~GHVO01010317.1.p1  ORF type:complete len:355 (+),score=47.22 GHVO01010317.1:24-1067(+)